MKVTLVNYDDSAREMLIFTKSTRLNMNPDLLDIIMAMDEKAKDGEVDYIANTIPSSWEFVDYTFLIQGVSRAFTHQFVRTRHGSYAQQTMRIDESMGGYDFVTPRRIREHGRAQEVMLNGVNVALDTYKELLKLGVAAEDARSVLPIGTASNIVAKFNLRTLAELVRSRAGGRTQEEYRDVVRAMADEVLAVHPWAEKFLFPAGRDAFDEIEEFAEKEYGGDLKKKGVLLKIVDRMRKMMRAA